MSTMSTRCALGSGAATASLTNDARQLLPDVARKPHAAPVHADVPAPVDGAAGLLPGLQVAGQARAFRAGKRTRGLRSTQQHPHRRSSPLAAPCLGQRFLLERKKWFSISEQKTPFGLLPHGQPCRSWCRPAHLVQPQQQDVVP